MDLSQPVRAVIPTLEGPVLEVLGRTKRPLTGREVHRLAHTGSPNGVRLALARLAEQGVVDADERSIGIFYTANRDHLAWPAIEYLIDLRNNMIQRLRDELGSWQVPADHASLFGSAARADGDATSDVDILLIRPDGVNDDDAAWTEQIDRLRHSVARWTGNRCHPFELDRHRLAQHLAAQDPLVDALVRDAVHLAGSDLRAVLKNLPNAKANR